MLNLASKTDHAWVDRASLQMEEVLVDHAHCEKKAASTAISLLFRYPHLEPLQIPLARLAREELAHFETVLGPRSRLGMTFKRQKPSPSAGELLTAVRPREPDRLLDTLLCLALIEARSCERMKLLAENLADPELRALYQGLLASEARHHQSYVSLAQKIAGEQDIRSRLLTLATHEATVLSHMPKHMARMHT